MLFGFFFRANMSAVEIDDLREVQFCPDDLVHGIWYSFIVFFYFFSGDLHTRFIRVLSI